MIYLLSESLGMHHDSSGNVCPKDGYIMSPSRGIRGETTWSDCSREIAKMLSQMKTCLLDKPPSRNDSDTFLEHSRYHDLPGREWTAKKQCELLLRDKDANIVTLYQVCQSLQCRTPHRSAYYFAGPALDGKFCSFLCKLKDNLIFNPFFFYLIRNFLRNWQGMSRWRMYTHPGISEYFDRAKG